MIDGPIGLAFVAGTVAAFNPCGFALLPGYLAYYLGSSEGSAGPGRIAVVASSVVAGFSLVFLIIGAIVVSVSSTLLAWAPWAGIVVGALLIPMGITLVRGHKLSIPMLGGSRNVSGDSPAAMFGYGVMYAMVSLACTIPAFLVTVSTSFNRTGFISGIAVFGAYSAGMAAVLITLTIVVALAREQMLARMRRVLPLVERISGWLVIVAGIYSMYYGWFQLRIVQGDPVATGPAELVAGVSEPVSRFIGGLPTIVVLGLPCVVLVAAVLTLKGRRAVDEAQTLFPPEAST